MTEKVFARQIDGGLWQWRQVADHGGWASEYYSTGDAEAVAASRPSTNSPVVVGIAGQHVLCRDVEIEAKDRRHIAKLLPYELEDYLIDSVEDMHFAFSSVENNSVPVLYVHHRVLDYALQPLLENRCDIPLCIPEYLLLMRESNGATLIYEGDKVIAHLAEGKGFAIDTSLAARVLGEIDLELNSAAVVNLVADSEEKLETLASWLPSVWREANGPDIRSSEGGFWDWVDPTLMISRFNMRRGRYARQLPFARWLQLWKVPVAVVGFAFLLSVMVNFGEYLAAKSENAQISRQIAEIYQKAVPGSKSRDPEGDLRSKVKSIAKKSEPSNFMVLFNSVAVAMKSVSDVTMSSVRYNSDQQELQLNLEGKDFGALEGVRGQVTGMGMAAEFLRVDKQADAHSARMKVTEVK